MVAVLGAVALVGTSCDSLNTGGDGPLVPKLPSDVLPVDAEATGNETGTTWKNAFTELQPALDSAEAGDEIWITQGTYVPSEARDPGDERTATFEIPAGVELYGGFTGNERERSERDPENNTTILSGDRGVEDDAADNCYHVVTTRGDAETVVDGVTITGGNANGGQQPDSDHRTR